MKSDKMKTKIYIGFLMLTFLSGCRGFIGGLDDSNVEASQTVFINTSPYDLTFIIDDEDWMGPDTVKIESEGGLKKYDIDLTYNLNYFDYAELSIEGKGRICYDFNTELPHNPCKYGFSIRLEDTYRNYYVFEFTKDNCNELLQKYEELKQFEIYSLYPSVVREDTLFTEGSSEALFSQVFIVPEAYDEVGIGTLVSKTAESIDQIGYSRQKIDVHQDSIKHYDFNSYVDFGTQSYYCFEDLKKTSLAHFGCDFTALTGRTEMDRFCGVIFSRYKGTAEWTDDLQDIPEDNLAIKNILTGQIMILLAEADCSASVLEENVRRTIMHFNGDLIERYGKSRNLVFHLITRGEDGRFQSCTGGLELVERYVNGIDDEPNLPLCFEMVDADNEPGYLHIKDILLEDSLSE